ncbi:MAG: TonB-dependent siderophore receptor, partial [Ferruginibacter sp.]
RLRDVPQAISYVTKELISDQQAFSMSDILYNMSGISQNSYTNNKFIVRGFESESKQTLINGLKGFSGERNGDVIPYAERVEAIKGPASALFANASPGGTINLVTKKPLDENRKSTNFAVGSWNTVRLTSDFTGPMNESHTLLYRLNMAYQNAGSFRVLQGKETFVVAPSVSFIPDNKTRVNFDVVYIHDDGKNDRGQPSMLTADGKPDIYSTPISFALVKANDYVKSTKLFSTISLQRKLSSHISFNASYLKSIYHEDMQEHRTSNRYAVDVDGNDIRGLFEMQCNYRLTDNYSDNLSTYFIFDVNTGPLKHKILVGYDYIQSADGLGNTTYNASGYLSADGKSSISKYDKNHPEKYLVVDNRPVPNVPHFSFDNPDYSISERSSYINIPKQDKLGKYFTNGIYIQDQVKWGKVQALLALRQEYYTDVENYGKNNTSNVRQHELLPRIGLVYTPFKPVSFYGTYTYGFQPQSAGIIGSPETYGGPFSPLSSNMVEAGAKMDWLQNRLSANIAIYRIEENNILINAGDPGNPDMLRQIGQQVGKGIELDVYGNIFTNLSVTANLAFNNNEITKSDDKSQLGRQADNAPKAEGGIWVKYIFSARKLHGLGLALGSNFQQSKLAADGKLNLPGYTLANAALYYTIDKFKISANFNNIFNKTYWLGADSFTRLFPGKPGNMIVGIGYTF